MNDMEILTEILNEIKGIKTDLSEFKQETNARFESLETEMGEVKKELIRNTTAIQEECFKIIDVLGEGYDMTRDRIKDLEVGTLNSRINDIDAAGRVNKSQINILTEEIARLNEKARITKTN